MTDETWHGIDLDTQQEALLTRRIAAKAVLLACEHFDFHDLLLPLVPERLWQWSPRDNGMKFYPNSPEKTSSLTGATVTISPIQRSMLHVVVRIDHPLDLVRRSQFNEYDERCREREHRDGSLPAVEVDLRDWWELEGESVALAPPIDCDDRRPVHRTYQVKGSL